MGGGLATTYDVHVRFIVTRVVNFLLVLTELFSLGVTAEALYGRKYIENRRVGQYPPNFRVEGDVSHKSFLHG